MTVLLFTALIASAPAASLIDSAIAPRLPALKKCFKQAEVDITVRFSVDANGQAVDAPACVLKALEGAKFPAVAGAPRLVMYTFSPDDLRLTQKSIAHVLDLAEGDFRHCYAA